MLIAFAVGAFVGAGPGRADADGPRPAQAREPSAPPRLGASDTGRSAAVPAVRGSERWYCTPTACTGASSSPASAAAGFAATSLAAIWISRKRPTERC
jgi:LPXTG-motif cell wall-anchored protein